MKSKKIYGPPGTGKTYTMLKFFEEELKRGVKPERIGFVTFTRTARKEVLERSGMPEEQLPYVKTLHATCYKALNIDQTQLVTRKDLVEFGTSIGVHLTGFMPDLFSLEAAIDKFQQPTKADRLLQLNHLGRHRGLQLRDTLRDAPVELDFKYAKWFTQSYRDWKTATAKLDYTDLLTEYLGVGNLLDLDVLFVDEAQDLSWLQWKVVAKLKANCQRMYIAGDDDQAIFVWAGASAALFNLEPADESIVLPQSYRLPRVVHRLSQDIIRRVKVRQEKEFRPREEDGEYRPTGHLDYGDLDGPSTLVLYRNFHRGTALSLRLEDLAIPFAGANAVFSNPDVRGAVGGWAKFKKNEAIPLDEIKAMVELGSKACFVDGITEITNQKGGEFSAPSIFSEKGFTAEFHQFFHRMPRLAYVSRAIEANGVEACLNPKIQLLSIHQSKGKEADTVVLDLEMARKTYESYLKEPDDEHRVQYVAVTRAKRRLLTLLASETMSYQL